MNLLELQDVQVLVKKQLLLNVPNFSLKKGEVMGVIGPNGAGKSTLLKTLAFLQTPTSGNILYKGEKQEAGLLPIELRRKFAVAMQQSLLFDTSVFDNVAVGLKLRRENKKIMKEKVGYWLDVFKIPNLSEKHARSLSGGEAQRVNLARAFILEPEIVFLDEAFSALDVPTKVELIHELKDIIQKTSTTTLFVSHDLLEIRHLTKSVAVMLDGQIKQIGETEQVILDPNEEVSPFLTSWKNIYTL